MRDFTLVSYKMIRVDYNQFDKHFCFIHYVFVFKNKVIFPLQQLSLKNQMCNGMSTFIKKICFMQTCRGRVKNCCQQWKAEGAAHFSFHICRYIKEIKMLHDLLLFKKTVQTQLILLKFSIKLKQMNLFAYLCHTFLWKINST